MQAPPIRQAADIRAIDSRAYADFIAQVHRAARAFRALAGDAEPRVGFLLPAAYFTLWGAEIVRVA